MKTIASYLIFASFCIGIIFIAAIPWPSTVYILFGVCDSSAEYVAGECAVNTGNWDWCVTEQFVEKMRQSDCRAQNGQLYYSRETADLAHARLKSANN